MIDVVLAQVIHHRVPTLHPRRQRHARRRRNRVGHTIQIMRIDQQRLFHLIGCTGQQRQHQYTRILRILCCHKFLGDQIHAVAQWRYQAHGRSAIKPGQRGMAEVLVDVTQRCPIRLRMTTVDMPGDLLKLPAQLAIFVDVPARDRRDLQIGEAAGLIRIALQIALKPLEALGQTFGIIQAIHADRELAPTQAFAQIAHCLLGDRRLGLIGNQVGIDADRERSGAEATPTRAFHQVALQHASATEQAHIRLEAFGIALGLEANRS